VQDRNHRSKRCGPDELFGKAKAVFVEIPLVKTKRKKMPNTVSTQATSDLGPKLVRAEQALSAIPPGSRVYLGTGCAAPRKLLAALEAMSPGPADLEFVSFVTTSAVPEEAGVARTRYRHRTFFVGSDVRGLGGSGQLDYVPISLEDVPTGT
jgi:acyl-CoA hydrolase